MSLSEAKRLYSQGRQKLAAGDLQGAVDKFKKALPFHPNYYLALLDFGGVMLLLKRYEQAVSYFDRAISIKPHYCDAWIGKGLTLFLLKRYEQAINHFDRAIAIKPDRFDTWNVSAWSVVSFAMVQLKLSVLYGQLNQPLVP